MMTMRWMDSNDRRDFKKKKIDARDEMCIL